MEIVISTIMINIIIHEDDETEGGETITTQKGDVSRVLKEFQAAFTDAPGKTNVMKYGFTLNNSRPIRMKPCPIPFVLQMSLNSDIEQILNLGVIESPYSTPLIAIKKKDDSNMLCLDIHKLNMLTVYEAKPNWTRMPT